MKTASFGVIAAVILAASAAFAADGPRLAKDVVPAPFGYDPAAGKYVVAEPTRIYVSTFLYPGTIDNNTLKTGQTVDVLAKAKDYDWVLVGRNGIGVGYIPLARLTPAK